MRIASSLAAFLFLNVAAAGVIPDIAGRSGGKGGQSVSVSGVHSYHSGFPTGTTNHSIPSSVPTYTRLLASEDGANPASVHSIHPISRRAEATGSHHSYPSVTPTRTGNHSTQSISEAVANPASVHSIHPISRRGDQTGSHHPHPSGSPTGTVNHSVPNSIPTLVHSMNSEGAANPTSVHSIHPVSRNGNATGSHYSHPSGAPTASTVSDYPFPSHT